MTHHASSDRTDYSHESNKNQKEKISYASSFLYCIPFKLHAEVSSMTSKLDSFRRTTILPLYCS